MKQADPTISASEAITKFSQQIHIKWKVTLVSDITSVNLEYAWDEKKDEFIPAWKVVANYDAPVLLDAVTGEAL